MRKPNLFIVGAAKSGTTSLYYYLKQHSDIYMSPLKEPKFFSVNANKFPHNGPGDDVVDRTVIKTLEDYLNLFSQAKNEKYLGEASADYLYFHEIVAPKLKAFNPESKIIIILRNPVDRAFSAYKHLVRDGRETLSFREALRQEKERIKNNYEFIWYYVDVGFYFNHVSTYIHLFRDNVKVILYDDLVSNPFQTLCDLYNFLGINQYIPDSINPYNVSYIPKVKSLENFLDDYNHPVKKFLRPIVLKTLGKGLTEQIINYIKKRNLISLDKKTRKFLIRLYQEDILKLQELIQKDLSRWLNSER